MGGCLGVDRGLGIGILEGGVTADAQALLSAGLEVWMGLGTVRSDVAVGWSNVKQRVLRILDFANDVIEYLEKYLDAYPFYATYRPRRGRCK